MFVLKWGDDPHKEAALSSCTNGSVAASLRKALTQKMITHTLLFSKCAKCSVQLINCKHDSSYFVKSDLHLHTN